MFTGIIEEIGRIKKIERGRASARLTIEAECVLEDVKEGDSIAVDGICLTVTSFSKSYFVADVMHETMNRTMLSGLQAGSVVNLERAMAANGRFGGHIVSGHIDGRGKVVNIEKDDNAILYTIAAASNILKYIVEKGSITINGISLTVARVNSESFTVSVIPHTLKVTTLGTIREGDQVNLENDILGKYIERLLGSKEDKEEKSKISMEFLIKNGF